MPLINSLPADIICDSFDLVVVQWNRETQTLRSLWPATEDLFRAFFVQALKASVALL